ncbi:MAG: hypothetical protein JRD02_06565 [Deltaproteobacteria bacterium]|nr:hypothetical protein [Deltaproteobacteria bacterium]
MVNNTWLAKNLDPHHVVIDVRLGCSTKTSHIKTAFAIEAGKLQSMAREFKAKKTKSGKRTLPALADKKAPIIIYGDETKAQDVLAAFNALVSGFRYKNVAVLTGGFKAWNDKGLPTEKGPCGTKIAYVKKLVKGAISPADFKKLEETGGAVVLDVRSKKTVTKGKLKNSIHIPLDNLEAGLGKLSKADKIIVHCKTGVRAEIAYNLLKNKGFKDVGFLNSIINIDKSGSYRIE